MVHDVEWPILERVEADQRGRRANQEDNETKRRRDHPWSPEWYEDQEEEEEGFHPWSPEWFADQEERVLVLIFV